MVGIISSLYGSEFSGWLLILIIVISVWKLIWYSLAIYKTLEKKQKEWFVILFVSAFVLNDLGILAILYLLMNKRKAKVKRKSKKR